MIARKRFRRPADLNRFSRNSKEAQPAAEELEQDQPTFKRALDLHSFKK
jgi:hypothetical protein